MDLSFLRENPDLVYIVLIVAVLAIEAWLGKTLRTKSGSILELLVNGLVARHFSSKPSKKRKAKK